MHMNDPKGGENYLKFMAYALPAYDAGRKAGKSPMQLLNPKSPDYIGQSIDSFTRPMNVWYNDVIVDHPGQMSPAPTSKFDINTVKSLGDLVSAFHTGKVTSDQAREYAVANGWAVVKSKPSAPISQ
jgi:hypothetical protein